MNLAWVFGRAKVAFHHSQDSVTLHAKTGGKTTLSQLCETTTPACYLNPFLFNGHLQTVWTAVRNEDVPVIYRRKIFEHEDPAYSGTFAVDFVAHEAADSVDDTLPPRTTYFTEEEFAALPSDDDNPMLVVLHGLSGGSYELYLRHVLAPLTERGWEACVVNSRGCANSEITSGVLYNARATWDVRQMIKWLRRVFPNRPLYGIGFSLGANILTNYLGEEGDSCALKAAVVCSNPWNLDAGSLALQRTWIGLNVYSRVMGGNMKKLFEQHIDQISKNPRVNIENVRKVVYLHEFDREVQGPTWGYPTEGAYYRDASSSDSVLAIRVPLLAINAEDDPIAAREAIPFEEIKQNPYVVLCTTSLGGHLAWFQLDGKRWLARAAVSFLERFADDVDIKALDEQRPLRNVKDTAPGATGPIFMPMRRKLKINVE